MEMTSCTAHQMLKEKSSFILAKAINKTQLAGSNKQNAMRKFYSNQTIHILVFFRIIVAHCNVKHWHSCTVKKTSQIVLKSINQNKNIEWAMCNKVVKNNFFPWFVFIKTTLLYHKPLMNCCIPLFLTAARSAPYCWQRARAFPQARSFEI